jgi:hypothetical protein
MTRGVRDLLADVRSLNGYRAESANGDSLFRFESGTRFDLP